ncbi:MAG TPA: sulfate ABC transporter permease subunit [Anaerolineae bacterium]|nr:sulfate ABC transporter permease subunit [Anaerolineae bacterium]
MYSAKGFLPKLLIGIVLAYLGVLIFLPIAAIVQGAFSKGIDALLEAFSDPTLWQAFVLSIELAIAAVIVNAIFGTIVAWVLVRQNFFGKGFFNALIDLPFVVSPVITGYMIILLFGRQGWLAPFVNAANVKIAFDVPGMLLVTVFVSLPFVVREVMPVLREIGTEPEQAAHTLGASGWRTFWRVTLPGIRWGLLYGISLTLARALGEFGGVLVAGGAVSGKTETATLFIYRAIEERQNIAAYGVALILAVISFVVLIGMEVLRKRTDLEVGS